MSGSAGTWPFCDPETHEALSETRDDDGRLQLRSPAGRAYEVRDGIPIFLDRDGMSDGDRWQERFYDRLAPWYDLGSAVHLAISREARRWREEYLAELTIHPDSRVLEVSIGTGANVPRVAAADFYGLDLSWRMLRRCRRKQRPGQRVTLCQGHAERLPFQSNAFDVVFHVGAINSFESKSRALAEMTRVARPGTRILVVDATNRFRERYRHVPVIRAVYGKMREECRAPLDALPRGVEDVQLKPIAAGELYCLTFRKPGAAG